MEVSRQDDAEAEALAQGAGEAVIAEAEEDPETLLHMAISMAQCELSLVSTELPEPSVEDLAAAELEQALILHQMSQEGVAYITGRPSVSLPAPASHSAAIPSQHSMHVVVGPSPTNEENEVQVETEMQKLQARIRRTVEQDIRKMLLSTKAYVKHHAAPPTISRKQICTLATPKASLLHADTALALEAGSNYAEYARRKTAQLQQARQQAEATQAQAALEADVLRQQLHNYRGWKGERAKLKADILAEESRQQQEYGRQVARYVAHKAAAELEDLKAQQALQRAKVAAVRQQCASSQRH